MIDLWVLGVLLVAVVIGIAIGFLLGQKMKETAMRPEIQRLERIARDDAVKRQRSVLGGKLAERLGPYLPDFPYDPSELRFIGEPIDFILFRGLAGRHVEEIVLLEVKSGKSKLNEVQRQVQDVVQTSRVRWEVFSVAMS